MRRAHLAEGNGLLPSGRAPADPTGVPSASPNSGCATCGAAPPGGFDCSGLVHHHLPAARQGWCRATPSTRAAAPDLAPVPLDDVRPGDLYFFARPGERVYHVGFATREVATTGHAGCCTPPRAGAGDRGGPMHLRAGRATGRRRPVQSSLSRPCFSAFSTIDRTFSTRPQSSSSWGLRGRRPGRAAPAPRTYLLAGNGLRMDSSSSVRWWLTAVGELSTRSSIPSPSRSSASSTLSSASWPSACSSSPCSASCSEIASFLQQGRVDLVLLGLGVRHVQRGEPGGRRRGRCCCRGGRAAAPRWRWSSRIRLITSPEVSRPRSGIRSWRRSTRTRRPHARV